MASGGSDDGERSAGENRGVAWRARAQNQRGRDMAASERMGRDQPDRPGAARAILSAATHPRRRRPDTLSDARRAAAQRRADGEQILPDRATLRRAVVAPQRVLRRYGVVGRALQYRFPGRRAAHALSTAAEPHGPAAAARVPPAAARGLDVPGACRGVLWRGLHRVLRGRRGHFALHAGALGWLGGADRRRRQHAGHASSVSSS